MTKKQLLASIIGVAAVAVVVTIAIQGSSEPFPTPSTQPSTITTTEAPSSTSVDRLNSSPDEIDYCVLPPMKGEDALFGNDIYPSDPKYKVAGWMAPVFTEDDCGGKKMNKIFGVRDGMYWPGSHIVFRIAPSPDLLKALKEIGYKKGSTCADSPDEECKNWRLEQAVPVSNILKLKLFIELFDYNDCVNCG